MKSLLAFLAGATSGSHPLISLFLLLLFLLWD